MFHLKKSTLPETVFGINPQYFCLAAALALEFLLMALRGYGFYFMENYIIVPTMLFLGMTFGKTLSPTARRQLLLSLGATFWFFIAQTLHYLMDMEVRNVGLFTSVYLLAFPFASFSRDGMKQWGLKLAAAACIGASLAMVCFTCLLSLDLLPGFLQPHIYWDGARLQSFWHPNICAIIFMMGIAFCLYLAVQNPAKWVKAMLTILAAVFFFNMSLTNSRTSIFMASTIIGGLLFFVIYDGKWKRFLIGAVAALAVIALLFTTASTIFQTHNDLLISKYLQQADAADNDDVDSGETTPIIETTSIIIQNDNGNLSLYADAGQSSLLGNLPNLNGRTVLWEDSIRYLLETPAVMLLGVDSSEEAIFEFWHLSRGHTHNSWIEIWMTLGLPGLVLSLLLTGIAVCFIWKNFWNPGSTLEQKIIALLVLCLMGAGMLEPYIFFSNIFYHYTDFIFFLCLGYLIHWRSEAVK